MNKDENKPNINTIILQLEVLISDWHNAKTTEVTDIAEEIIIDKAAELLEVARPQKSEMACNCPHECEGEELPKEFIDAMKEEFIDAMNNVANILGHMTETQKTVRKTFEN